MPSTFALFVALSGMAFSRSGSMLPVDSNARWGFRQGIQAAIHPYAIGDAAGTGGPRGLLRIGYPILPGGQMGLINFIAVEPTVAGRKGYSELEHGGDGHPGKRFTVLSAAERRVGGRHLVVVTLDVERFANGAHVLLEIRFEAGRPDEVELRASAAPDSAPIDECALSATMGNYERLRRAHLNERILESTSVYAHYGGDGFTDDTLVPFSELARTEQGDVIVCATPDEPDPRSSQESLPADTHWRYAGCLVTQYWRAPKGTYSRDLSLRVNGRRVYWMSQIELPGGIAFENFELRDRFRSGQPFVFGVTTRTPEAIVAPAQDESTRDWLSGWN